jgi:hypothetical protein
MAKALRSNHKPLPPIQGANGLVFSDVDKAEAFADSLELQCRPNVVDADPVHIEEIENQVRLILSRHDDNPITPASPSEIPKIIGSLKKKKEPGPDNISNTALKLSSLWLQFSTPASVSATFRPDGKTRQSFSSPSLGRTPNFTKVIAPSVFFQASERFSKKSS